jgi:Leucine-rich repeat (LRR) protein
MRNLPLGQKINYIARAPRTKTHSTYRNKNKENISSNQANVLANTKRNLAKHNPGLIDQKPKQDIRRTLVERRAKKAELLQENQPLSPVIFKNELISDEIMQELGQNESFDFTSEGLPNEMRAQITEYWALEDLLQFLKAVYVPAALLGESELRKSRRMMAQLTIQYFSGTIRLPQDQTKIALILKNFPDIGFRGGSSLSITEDCNWQEIAIVFPGVKSLELTSTTLESLEGIQLLTKLTALKLNCPQLQSLNGLAGLSHLTSLDVSGCQALRNLKGIERLNQLTTLKLNHCSSLESLEGIEHLSQLTYLEVSGKERLMGLNGIQKLMQLRTLRFKDCSDFRSLDLLANLPHLHSLDLSGCKNLESLQGIVRMRQLTHLSIHGCEKLRGLNGIDALVKLTYLNMDGCGQVESLAGLEALTGLKTLILKKCSLLEDLTFLAGLTQLVHLDVSWTNRLKRLKGIEHLTTLTHLDITQCSRLESLKGTEHLPQLKHSMSYNGIEGFENERLVI